MSNFVKDRHTLILKSKDRKRILICIDFLVHDVGVKIHCTAEQSYSVAFCVRECDFYLIDSCVMNLSTEMGRDVWKILINYFDFEHNCKSHCDSNIASTIVSN